MILDNLVVRELVLLEEEVKIKQRRIAEIKEACRMRGSFATMDFVVAVKEIKREVVGPSEMILNTLGRDHLERLGLIYTSTYLVVSAIPKLSSKKDVPL